MKARTKLFGGFIAVAALGVLLCIIGYYSNKKLTASSGDMLYLSDTKSRISSILSSHYKDIINELNNGNIDDEVISHLEQMNDRYGALLEKKTYEIYELVVTFEFGTSNDIRSLYNHANKALYEAKRTGRNSAVNYKGNKDDL